jgi:hypothetical protein
MSGIHGVSIGRRNALVFLERWSANDEMPVPDFFQEQTEVGDMGSMAARRVDEFTALTFNLLKLGTCFRRIPS